LGSKSDKSTGLIIHKYEALLAGVPLSIAFHGVGVMPQQAVFMEKGESNLTADRDTAWLSPKHKTVGGL
jgi:hypothetical protein